MNTSTKDERSLFNTTNDDFKEDLTSFRQPFQHQNGKRKKDKQLKKKSNILFVEKNEKKVEESKNFVENIPTCDSDLYKICPSCKEQIQKNLIADHISSCLQKFNLKNDRQKESSTYGLVTSTRASNHSVSCFDVEVNEKSEINGSAHFFNCVQNLNSSEEKLPYSVCLQNVKKNDLSHIKTCVQAHELSSEQSSLSSKLKSSRRKKVDPEMELALALSSSLSHEEANIRQREEEKLVELGLGDIVIEDRRNKPFWSPLPPNKVKKKGRRLCKEAISILACRTTEERERIISEKVASLLADTNTLLQLEANIRQKNNEKLEELIQKDSPLWNCSKGVEEKLEVYFVKELEKFIACRTSIIGELLKHFSQIPGRLNVTHAKLEESDSEGNEDEENEHISNMENSIVENYCTQLVLAELLDSQDAQNLTFTRKEANKKDKLEATNGGFWATLDSPEELNNNKNMGYGDIISDLNNEDEIMEISQCESLNKEIELPVICQTQSFNKSKEDNNALISINTDDNDNMATSSHNKSSINFLDKLYSNFEVSKDNSLFSKLIYDWSFILNCGHGADIILETAEDNINVHSLVLRVRCSNLYEEAKKSDWKLSWKTSSYEGSFLFLVYLYTGQCFLVSDNDNHWMEVYDLALKYKCEKLVIHLEKIYKASKDSVESNSMKNLNNLKCSPQHIEMNGYVYDEQQNKDSISKMKSFSEVSPLKEIEESNFSYDANRSLNSPDLFEESASNSVCTLSPLALSPTQNFNVTANHLRSSPCLKTCEGDLGNYSGQLILRNASKEPDEERDYSRCNILCSKSPSDKNNEDISQGIACMPFNDENLIDLAGDASDSNETVEFNISLTKPTSENLSQIENESISDITNKGEIIESDPPSPCINDVWESFEDVQHNLIHIPDLPNECSSHSSVISNKDLSPLKSGLNGAAEISVTKQKLENPSEVNLGVGDDTLLQAVTESEALLQIKNFNKSVSAKDYTPERSVKYPLTITPMPNYKNMVTPELKRELDRYGIRKMSRNKAIKLLVYIYDQIHPVVTDNEGNSSYFETPIKAKDKRSPKRKLIVSSTNGELVEMNSSQNSNTSLDTSSECIEETALCSDEDDFDLTSSQQNDLKTRIRQFIFSDSGLHRQILLYEPIWAQDFQASLKANGIKCGMKKLLDFFDEQCITFRLRTPNDSGTRKRRLKGCQGQSRKKIK